MIDLHVHTNASDGEHSPVKVIEIAKENHVSSLAITDHDTCSGVGNALLKGIVGDTVNMRQYCDGRDLSHAALFHKAQLECMLFLGEEYDGDVCLVQNPVGA